MSEQSDEQPTAPIMPYNDRRIHDVADKLDEWFDQQLARPQDDPPTMDEMDRLLGILGHAVPDLPDEAKRKLVTAWAAVFRLAVGWARQQVAGQHAEALERMAALWSALGTELELLAAADVGEGAEVPDLAPGALATLAREMMGQAATLHTRILLSAQEPAAD